MIIIKIKTWKDWKKAFFDFVKEPRRKTCKNYVWHMEDLTEHAVDTAIHETCKKYTSLKEEQIEDIILEANRSIYKCAKTTCKLIDDCQPNKLF